MEGPESSLCRNTSRITLIAPQSDGNLNHEDFIQFNNKPETVLNGYELSIHYLCSKPCVVNIEIVASSEFRTGISVYKKRWKCEKHLHTRNTRIVTLNFPSIIAYREDYFIRHSIAVHSVILKAWIVHRDAWDKNLSHSGTYLQAVAKTYALLEPVPVSERPFKEYNVCYRWDMEYMRNLNVKTAPLCPYESDAVDILNFLYASSGEKFGIIKTFDRFKNKELELTRKHYVDDPRFTFSVWLYLLDWCESRMCSIIHHIDRESMYDTPILFLTESGKIHVQLRQVSEVDIAVKSHFSLSLRRWCRLDLTLEGRKMTLTASYKENMEGREYLVFKFDEDIYHNDTVGYFVLGGSQYVPGIQGFFGPVKYYRLKVMEGDKIFNPLFDEGIIELLDEHYQRCEDIQEIILAYTYIANQGKRAQENSTCDNYYLQLSDKYGEMPVCDAVFWDEEMQTRYQKLFELLREMESDLSSGSSDSSDDDFYKFGEMIFEKVTKRLSNLDGLQSIIPSLKDSSCCGYHKATYFLAVIFQTGLGVSVDPLQGLLYSLIGAQGDNRHALMQLGYKHSQGIDGYPLDYDLSFGYYANIAEQTSHDRQNLEGHQAFVEIIRLIDDDSLKFQTKEDDDVFLWIKYQAKRGDAVAQQQLARMLYWGQQGVAKNTKAAAEWYAKAAKDTEDPVLMYDYAIILLKGQGVKKNKKLALRLLKKAAKKGSHHAFNGLGWYYHSFQKNYVKAKNYWEEALQLGSVDAAHNLAVLYLDGLYPGKGKNESLAFEYFYKAAQGGHMEGAIRCSHYFITGKLESTPRNPETAVLWAKYVAEQNGYLGYDLRKALNAYLGTSWQEALLYYLVSAETGIEVAQTNTAYLCEEIPELARKYLDIECAWHYYNFSAHQIHAPSFAYLKMGDFYYYGYQNHTRDIKHSIKMYARAASVKDSQGFYNLASLIEEGIPIPTEVLDHLEINRTLQSNNVSVLLELYERCRIHNTEDSISPCSLALLLFHLKVVRKVALHSVMAGITGTVFLSVLIAFLVKHFQQSSDHDSHTDTQGQSTAVHSSSVTSDTGRSTRQEAVTPTESAQRTNLSAGQSHTGRRDVFVQVIRGINQRLQRHRSIGEWLITLLGICMCIGYIVALIHLM
nr:PREDICTED: protein sel-1 homolog 3 isoform X2 [Latimeria chalumnae]|eukprot:XP_006002722.1 PREDICTED: protein sel-1 homolog 3 isoform X2 [Latimeria chalumnae]